MTNEPDGYQDEDDVETEELDLSFLDDDPKDEAK